MIQEKLSLYNLSKFNENQILFTKKSTKQLYQYYPIATTKIIKTIIYHPLLESPIKVQTGYLYPKEILSIEKDIEVKRKQMYFENYQTEQLINTFIPIIKCIIYIHKEGETHGGICLKNIIVDKNGQIKLRNCIQSQKRKIYYNSPLDQIHPEDDMKAIGYMILQCITFKTISQLKQQSKMDELLRNLIRKTTKQIIIVIYILINKLTKYHNKIVQILENKIQTLQNFSELHDLFQKIRTQKQQKKTVFTPPLLTHSQQQMQELVSKKIGPTTIKKYQRFEDCQNKKYDYQCNTSNKYKNNAKTNVKILQRQKNNIMVNEATRNKDALKKMSNRKSSYAGYLQDYQFILKKPPTIRQQLIRTTNVDQPKRLRTVSRKKMCN